MTPELAAALRDSFNQNVMRPLAYPDTPESFYWRERFGPELTSTQLWRTVHELTAPSDSPATLAATSVEGAQPRS